MKHRASRFLNIRRCRQRRRFVIRHLILVCAGQREVLYERINARACLMFENGLIEEAKSLRDRGYTPDLNALNAFGYREIFQYLNGEMSLDRALADLQQDTRRYAKRQMTFFRRDERIAWMDGCDDGVADAILKHVDMADEHL